MLHVLLILTFFGQQRSSSSRLAAVLDLSDNDNLLAVGAAAAAAIAGIGFVSNSNNNNGDTGNKAKTSKSSSSQTDTPKVDVSIPYSAAAMLAYDTMRGNKKSFDEEAFAKFEELYIEQSVTLAKSKKIARDHAREMKGFNDKLSSIEKEMASLTSA